MSVFEQLKYFLPSGPIFPVLGNHDSNPEAIDAPHSLPGVLGQQQSWNYEHVAGLWQQSGWISSEGAAQARMHYAAYSINHPSKPSPFRLSQVKKPLRRADNRSRIPKATNYHSKH